MMSNSKEWLKLGFTQHLKEQHIFREVIDKGKSVSRVANGEKVNI